jgi:bifunctional non-homologous end joining protein LigD
MAPKVRRTETDPATSARSELAEYRRKRDFSRTPEPRGEKGEATGGELTFVVQRHAARRLHFDLRLELDGVMKSWAVPKGPSLDPSTKRLAVQVEDHPMAYNSFEGTIPAGEYGGGTVMLWDRGSFAVDGLTDRSKAERVMRKGLREGKLSLTFRGERLHGGYALVRSGAADDEKPQWLLIKQDDEFADPDRDLATEATTSIETGRTMQEIAEGRGGRRVWRAGGEHASGNVKRTGGSEARQARHRAQFSPMLATPAREPPNGAGWTYEPKWDGIRVLAFAAVDGAALVTRNGNDKARQFPDVARPLRDLARTLGRPLVLDGELVGARDGQILRFESLQSRMHTENAGTIRRLAEEEPAALVAFDLLLDGDDVLVREPWSERRARLEALFADLDSATVLLGESTRDRETLLRKAREQGWEGLIAKRMDAAYHPGTRSRHWLKLKLENRQEFVVGGWTEPRNSRQYIGALLLGYYDESGALRYAGHTGTGFSQDELRSLHARLRRLERKTAPFAEQPATNERAHWTTPRIVVEVRFNEWTRKGILRQPVYVGLRDDREPAEVVREPTALPGGDAQAVAEPTDDTVPSSPPARNRGSLAARTVAELERVEAEGGSGTLPLGRAGRLEVTSLGKVFFPRIGKTKGALLRYYAGMADHILPFMKDRPLVLKRFPDGEGGKSFYQQNAPENVPKGVRVETIHDADGSEQRRFVGGNLATLLHTVQLGAISYDPWHSRVGRLRFADYTILDLDPGPGATFRVVVAVARAVKEELDRTGLTAALKTSGSTGLHIYIPIPARTPLESATLAAQILATRVAARHPKIATVERMTRNRPRGTVYVDYLQNILGKTVAGVYAARARPLATVSTPLDWTELSDDLDPDRFTIDSVPGRIARKGELWGPAIAARNSLTRILPPS